MHNETEIYRDTADGLTDGHRGKSTIAEVYEA